MSKEYQWQQVEIEFVRGNKFFLIESPTHTNLNGLEIEFEPSSNWIRKNKGCEPRMKTDLIAGKEIYKLPSYFRKKTIKKVMALLPSPQQTEEV